MQKFTDDEYKIFENIAQAKSILRKNGGTIEDDMFLTIVDATKKDGWTGLLTRLVYVDEIDVDEVIGIYPDLKKSKLDLGKLSKMDYDQIIDELYSVESESESDIQFVARTEEYLIFHVKNYEAGLDIISPSWCTKTKSHWDTYNMRGYQFVIIEDGYVNKKGKTKLMTPNSKSYMGSYSNTKRPSVRYGVSVNSRGDLTIFDDNNNPLYPFNLPIGVVNEIEEYVYDERGTGIGAKPAEYDLGRSLIYEFIDNLGVYWSSVAYAGCTNNLDEVFEKFMIFVKHHNSNFDMIEFYRKFRSEILEDAGLMEHCAEVDYILYRLCDMANCPPKDITLGGYLLGECDPSDHSFKYVYGYSQNKYGRLYILQSYNSLTEWYVYLMTNLGEVFGDSIGWYGEGDSEFVNIFDEDRDRIEILDIFTNKSPVSNADFVSTIFYVDQFIETCANWAEVGLTTDGKISDGELIKKLVDMSEVTPDAFIIKFVNAMPQSAKQYDYYNIKKINVDQVIEYFRAVFNMNEQNKFNTTSLQMITNDDDGSNILVIRFHFKPVSI